MPRERNQANRFLRQLTWLIVVPMLLLSVGGAYALWLDRRAVLSEAKEHCQQFAGQVADRIASSLPSIKRSADHKAPGECLWFNEEGDLVAVGRGRIPVDYPAIPQPVTYDVGKLDETQLAFWNRLNAPADGRTGTNVISGAGLLTEADLPSPFRELATYALGCRSIDAGRVSEGVATLRSIPLDSKVRLPTGIPASPMGRLKILQTYKETPADPSAFSDDQNDLCSAALRAPSLMTPRFLDEADSIAWSLRVVPPGRAFYYRETWNRKDSLQAFHDAAVRETAPATWRNGMRWVRWKEHDCFLRSKVFRSIQPGESGEIDNIVRIFSEDDVRQPLESKNPLSSFPGRPGYARIDARLAGRTVLSGIPDTSRWMPPDPDARSDDKILGSATADVRMDEVDYTSPVEVRVVLDDPARLYARQNTRLAIFGGLLIVAVAATVAGLFGAWRAFRRQQQLNDMQSDFVSSVTHELRAPVASVRLMAEGLDTGRVSGEGKLREYHRFISRECARLSSLIENVLDFSRIERDARRYEFEPTDVAALIDSVEALMTPVAADADIALVFERRLPSNKEDAAQPVIDGRAVQQTLVNLVDNAVKHSPPDGQVIVAIEQTSVLRFRVADAGPGIPIADRERIFNRFYRRGSELRRETTGVGIGLSIVKHVVDAHRGTIRVDDNENGGSSFVIKLPLTPEGRTSNE